MQKDDGLVGETREARVDVRDGVSYATGQFIGFGGLEANLDQDDLRMVVRSNVTGNSKGALTFPCHSGYLSKNVSNAWILCRTP